MKRQLEAFGELFNSEASKVRFRGKNYSCPFDKRLEQCNKPNSGNVRYGSCSAEKDSQRRIICPRRFYENDYQILKDIRNFIWGSGVPTSAYDEVKLLSNGEERFDYGNLDWILKRNGAIEKDDFIGIEIQSDATTSTGSFDIAIKDLIDGNIKSEYTFGFNTLASFKGFLPQFIFKGQLFDEWKKPYVAVMQDELWDHFIAKFRIRFHEISKYSTETFVFFIYALQLDPVSNHYHLVLKKKISTRWVDLLFAFAVEGDLLINFDEAKKIIERKITRYHPICSF